MLRCSDFLQVEKDAALLKLNNGFLAPGNVDTLIESCKDWPALAGVTEPDSAWVHMQEEPDDRIYQKDAERTFRDEANINAHTRLLFYLKKQLGDYHQGLSYVTGFLKLTLDESIVAAIALQLGRSDKYIPKFWRAEAVEAATNAYVFEEILKERLPDVAAHLAKAYILPETFCQKWFIGLCTQILPLEALFPFFRAFLQQGFPFLIKFGLALLELRKTDVLATCDVTKLYALLRMEGAPVAFCNEVVAHAAQLPLGEYDWAAMRTRLFKDRLEARMLAAKKAAEDAANAESDSDGSEEEGEECGICHEGMPDYFCEQCEVAVCEDCHSKSKGAHSKKHAVHEYTEADVGKGKKEGSEGSEGSEADELAEGVKKL